MLQASTASDLRVQKRRVEATLTLTTGLTVRGYFFLWDARLAGEGSERPDELLNSAHGFFPFERLDGRSPRVVLYNVALVSVVTLAEHAGRAVPGYEVAAVRHVSLLMSSGQTLSGTIRIHRPAGCDRVSDWLREPEAFRYLETDRTTLLVNIHHVAEVVERESR